MKNISETGFLALHIMVLFLMMLGLNWTYHNTTMDKIDETNARLDAIYLILNEEEQ